MSRYIRSRINNNWLQDASPQAFVNCIQNCQAQSLWPWGVILPQIFLLKSCQITPHTCHQMSVTFVFSVCQSVRMARQARIRGLFQPVPQAQGYSSTWHTPSKGTQHPSVSSYLHPLLIILCTCHGANVEMVMMESAVITLVCYIPNAVGNSILYHPSYECSVSL